MRRRLRLAALAVLLFGLAVGGGIYLGAGEADPAASSYVIVGGVAYPVDPGTSRTYVRQLERFGGKTSVLFDELGRWFAARWQGRELGVTIAGLGVAAALVLAAIARRAPK